MKKYCHSINQLLHPEIPDAPSQLNHLLDRAGTLSAINQVLAQHLPPNQQQNCRISNITRHSITITTTNAAWCSRLRFNQNQILQLLRQNGYPWLANLDIKVSQNSAQISSTSEEQRKQHQQKIERQFSSRTVDSLNQLSLSEHPQLAKAAAKLAQTMQKRRGKT